MMTDALDGDVDEARLVVRRIIMRGGAHRDGLERAAAVQDVGHGGGFSDLDLRQELRRRSWRKSLCHDLCHRSVGAAGDVGKVRSRWHALSWAGASHCRVLP